MSEPTATMEYQEVLDEGGNSIGFQPIIHIHVPEQPPPVINITLPEQGPPQVTVEAKAETPTVQVVPEIVVPPSAVNVQPSKGRRIIRFNLDSEGNPISAEINDA